MRASAPYRIIDFFCTAASASKSMESDDPKASGRLASPTDDAALAETRGGGNLDNHEAYEITDGVYGIIDSGDFGNDSETASEPEHSLSRWRSKTQRRGFDIESPPGLEDPWAVSDPWKRSSPETGDRRLRGEADASQSIKEFAEKYGNPSDSLVAAFASVTAFNARYGAMEDSASEATEPLELPSDDEGEEDQWYEGAGTRCGSSHPAGEEGVSVNRNRWPRRRRTDRKCEAGVSTDRISTHEIGVGTHEINEERESDWEALITQVEIEYLSAKARGKQIKITITEVKSWGALDSVDAISYELSTDNRYKPLEPGPDDEVFVGNVEESKMTG